LHDRGLRRGRADLRARLPALKRPTSP
jgi:hypothetical protein